MVFCKGPFFEGRGGRQFQYLEIRDFAAIRRFLVKDRLYLPRGKLEICKRQQAGVSSNLGFRNVEDQSANFAPVGSYLRALPPDVKHIASVFPTSPAQIGSQRVPSFYLFRCGTPLCQ